MSIFTGIKNGVSPYTFTLFISNPSISTKYFIIDLSPPLHALFNACKGGRTALFNINNYHKTLND